MKQFMLAVVLGLLCTSPALAAPWQFFSPVQLLASGTSASIFVGEECGPIESLRFQIDGAKVQLHGLVAIPVQGEPILLRVPVMLKSGEGSGLIRLPSPGVKIKSLRLQYRITEGKPATLVLKVKAKASPLQDIP